jgi:hypothetical protein
MRHLGARLHLPFGRECHFVDKDSLVLRAAVVIDPRLRPIRQRIEILDELLKVWIVDGRGFYHGCLQVHQGAEKERHQPLRSDKGRYTISAIALGAIKSSALDGDFEACFPK